MGHTAGMGQSHGGQRDDCWLISTITDDQGVDVEAIGLAIDAEISAGRPLWVSHITALYAVIFMVSALAALATAPPCA